MCYIALVWPRIEVREIASRKVTVISQALDEDTSVATVVIRAATENVINDVERALSDGVHGVQSLFADPRLLPGAGAVELELSKQLKVFADEVCDINSFFGFMKLFSLNIFVFFAGSRA